MDLFAEVIAKCEYVDADAAHDFSEKVQELRDFQARAGALFAESIMVYAMTGLGKQGLDAKAKKRHMSLVASQVTVVEARKFGTQQDAIQGVLWQKAQEIKEQLPATKASR